MAKGGSALSAILAIWNDYVGSDEAEYEAWYQDEHVPQRLGFAGFRQARRYEAIEADRRYFTWYGLDSAAVLRDPAYLSCLDDPTPRTRAAMPGFHGMIRAELVVPASAGRGIGGFAVCLRRDTGSVDTRMIAGWLEFPGVVSVQVWATRGTSAAASSEMRFRNGADGMASAALVVECRRQADAAHIAGLLATRIAGDAAAHVGQYQLLSCVDGDAGAAAGYWASGQPPSESGR